MGAHPWSVSLPPDNLNIRATVSNSMTTPIQEALQRWRDKFACTEEDCCDGEKMCDYFTVKEMTDVLAAELSAAEERARQETIEEIIRDIPICNDKFTKCSCPNHDDRDAIFNYLYSLTSKNNDQ